MSEPEARVEILLRRLCDRIPEPRQGHGRPPLPLGDAVFAAATVVRIRTGGRRAATHIQACVARGLLAQAPSYNSVLRYLDRPALTPLYRMLIEQSGAPLRATEGAYRPEVGCFATTKKGPWLRASATVGVQTSVVASVEVDVVPRPFGERAAPALRALKRELGERVRAKTLSGQVNEVLLKCVCHNLGALLARGLDLDRNAFEAKGDHGESASHSVEIAKSTHPLIPANSPANRAPQRQCVTFQMSRACSNTGPDEGAAEPKFPVFGEMLSLAELAEASGCAAGTIARRMLAGKGAEDAAFPPGRRAGAATRPAEIVCEDCPTVVIVRATGVIPRRCPACAVERARAYARKPKGIPGRGRPRGRARTPEEERKVRVEREQARIRKRREAGLCVQCEAPSPERNLCDGCTERRRARRRKASPAA
jgi:hypothetical protein